MPYGTRILRYASVSGTLAGLPFTGPAWTQPGTVLSNQKVSNLEGNYTAIIDSGDQFGSAVACLGISTVPARASGAIAVGSVGDDDGVLGAGAVYILFLSAGGTVLSTQKISDTVNLPGAPIDGLDEFGGSLASLGDLDGLGPSTHATAVGSVGDDDGGGDLGAVTFCS